MTGPTFYVDELIVALESLDMERIVDAADALSAVSRQGGSIFIAGNGGSAATASHFACDLSKAAATSSLTRPRAFAITDSVPMITAWSNDESYPTALCRILDTVGREGDILVVLSASGCSPNIIQCVQHAKTLGIDTLALLGNNGGELGGLVNNSIIVKGDHYGIIEDVHLSITHMLVECITGRPNLIGRPGSSGQYSYDSIISEHATGTLKGRCQDLISPP